MYCENSEGLILRDKNLFLNITHTQISLSIISLEPGGILNKMTMFKYFST